MRPSQGAQLRFGDGSIGGLDRSGPAACAPTGRTRIGAAIHSVRAVPPLAMAEVAGWAGTPGLAVCTPTYPSSAREQTDCLRHRGTTPLGVLAAAGAVGPGFTAVHGTHLPTTDIAGLAAEGGGCCLCPTTERDLGDGIGPAAALRARRRAAQPSAPTPTPSSTASRKRGPSNWTPGWPAEERGLLDAGALLEAATENGMTALGWDAGALAPGPAGRLHHHPPGHTPHRRRRSRPWRRHGSVRRHRRRCRSSSSWRTAGGLGREPSRSSPTSAGELAAAISALHPMTSLAVTGIGLLVTCDPEQGRGPLGVVDKRGAWSSTRAWSSTPAPGTAPADADTRIDLGGRCVMPGFVDSHTHLIFAGDRAEEFALRMAGRPYRPGGILDTVAATRQPRRPQLIDAGPAGSRSRPWPRAPPPWRSRPATGSPPSTKPPTCASPAPSRPKPPSSAPTWCPPEFAADRGGYLRLLIETMIPAAAGTARWCDVFCETGAFDVDESRAVLEAGRRHGMGLRVHANQLGPGGGVALACELGAASADHCTHLTAADVEALAGRGTVATLLPISDFCTRQPYPDGRALLDAGATVALASNCNPGSSYSTSIPWPWPWPCASAG